jgi:hypothetical protein
LRLAFCGVEVLFVPRLIIVVGFPLVVDGSVQSGIMFHHELYFVRDQACILQRENPSIHMKDDVLPPMFR